MICKIAAIRHLEFLKFRVCVMRPLMPCYSPSLCKNSLKSENLLLSYGQKNDCLKWRLSAILNFRGAIMGSLKMPCRTSYWSSIETIILDCFVYEKIAFLSRRSPGMGSRTARSRPRPRPVSSRPRPRPVIMIVEKIKKMTFFIKIQLLNWQQNVYQSTSCPQNWASVFTSHTNKLQSQVTITFEKHQLAEECFSQPSPVQAND